MKVVVVDESYLINKDIKMGDVCEVTEVGWFEYHPAVLVTKPNGSQFWYQKASFKPLDEIREEKINTLL
jgi:hypothetical protein